MTLTALDTFAGIGGFSLGLERTGYFETVAFCEIEPYPAGILSRHWPKVYIHDDITTLGYTREGDETDDWMLYDKEADHEIVRGPIDVISGGFPCQDISAAGNQAGLEGERSGLWSELFRLIGEARPRYAVLENVTNLLSGDRGRWFGRVLGDLASIGYCVEWHCIPASRLGARHRRDRVWIIAYPDPRLSEREDEELRPGRDALDRSGEDPDGPPDYSDTVSERLEGVLEAWATARPIDRPRDGSDPGWWTIEPDLGRVAHGVPARVDRLKALGNAIVPTLAYVIGLAIADREGLIR